MYWYFQPICSSSITLRVSWNFFVLIPNTGTSAEILTNMYCFLLEKEEEEKQRKLEMSKKRKEREERKKRSLKRKDEEQRRVRE